MADDQGRSTRREAAPPPGQNTGQNSGAQPRKASPALPIFLPPPSPAEEPEPANPVPAARRPANQPFRQPPATADEQTDEQAATKAAKRARVAPGRPPMVAPTTASPTGRDKARTPHEATTPQPTETTRPETTQPATKTTQPETTQPATKTSRSTKAAKTAPPAKATPPSDAPSAPKTTRAPKAAPPAKTTPTKPTKTAEPATPPATKATRPRKTASTAKTTAAKAADPPPPPPTTAEPVDPEPPTNHDEPVVTGELVPAQFPVPSLGDIARRPGHAAELLALAAVARYSGAATTTVAGLRVTYPNATAAGIARVAALRITRQARNRGLVSGLGGPLAVLADIGSLQALHAELVLHIAAAYGHDPQAPERAADLLVLTGVHPDLPAASRAVTVAAIGGPDAGPTTPLDGLVRPLASILGAGLLRLGARRLLSLIPGAGAVVGAVANVRVTKELAARATRFYEKR